MWAQGSGPDSDVVVSSRVRLARNLAGHRFPTRQSPEEATEVVHLVERAVAILEGPWDYYRLGPLAPVDRRVLVEKHLISPMLAKEAEHAALALSEDEAYSVMVNEEDHLRIQVLRPGRSLEDSLRQADDIDDRLEADLSYAFDPALGYLMASPANLGTAMRVSAMVHLPVLAMTGRLGPVLAAIQKVGYTVRGLYGEGSEASGNLFQVSNLRSLGPSEGEIVAQFDQVLRQLIQAERESREELWRRSREHLADRVGRAYGILTGAHLLTTAEAVRLLSDLRLGVALGLVPVSYGQVHALWVVVRGAFLSRTAGRELAPHERDLLRAQMVREWLRKTA
jgi:protein arginine kinase